MFRIFSKRLDTTVSQCVKYMKFCKTFDLQRMFVNDVEEIYIVNDSLTTPFNTIEEKYNMNFIDIVTDFVNDMFVENISKINNKKEKILSEIKTLNQQNQKITELINQQKQKIFRVKLDDEFDEDQKFILRFVIATYIQFLLVCFYGKLYHLLQLKRTLEESLTMVVGDFIIEQKSANFKFDPLVEFIGDEIHCSMHSLAGCGSAVIDQLMENWTLLRMPNDALCAIMDGKDVNAAYAEFPTADRAARLQLYEDFMLSTLRSDKDSGVNLTMQIISYLTFQRELMNAAEFTLDKSPLIRLRTYLKELTENVCKGEFYRPLGYVAGDAKFRFGNSETGGKETHDSFLKKLWEHVKSFFSTLTGWINTKIINPLGTLLEKAKDYITGLFDFSGSLYKPVAEFYTRFKPYIVGFGLLLASTLLFASGFIAASTYTTLISHLNPTMTAEDKLSDGVTVITALIGIFVTMAGAGGATAAVHWKRLLMGIAGTAALSKVVTSFISILPFGFRGFVAKCFGDKVTYFQAELAEIITDWTALQGLSYNVHIYQTDAYLNELEMLLARMTSLLVKVDNTIPGALVSLLSRAHSDCNRLHGTLAAGRDNDEIRPFPFWIHLYGEAGVGKSALLRRIAVSATERMIDPHNLKPMSTKVKVYNRNVADKFWSGYKPDQAITVIDEFMNVNTSANIELQALEMLCLASCVPYTLNMAEINPSPIGIKGTKFESDVIITCNNSYGLPFDGNVCEGLFRRRNLVINITRNAAYAKHVDGNGNWKIPANLREEEKQGKHLDFVVKKGTIGKPDENVIVLNGYDQVIKYIWDRQNEYAAIANRLCGSDYHYHDPNETISAVKRKFRGIYSKQKEDKNVSEDVLIKDDQLVRLPGPPTMWWFISEGVDTSKLSMEYASVPTDLSYSRYVCRVSHEKGAYYDHGGNLIQVDPVDRTPPKTRSALLTREYCIAMKITPDKLTENDKQMLGSLPAHWVYIDCRPPVSIVDYITDLDKDTFDDYEQIWNKPENIQPIVETKDEKDKKIEKLTETVKSLKKEIAKTKATIPKNSTLGTRKRSDSPEVEVVTEEEVKKDVPVKEEEIEPSPDPRPPPPLKEGERINMTDVEIDNAKKFLDQDMHSEEYFSCCSEISDDSDSETTETRITASTFLNGKYSQNYIQSAWDFITGQAHFPYKNEPIDTNDIFDIHSRYDEVDIAHFNKNLKASHFNYYVANKTVIVLIPTLVGGILATKKCPNTPHWICPEHCQHTCAKCNKYIYMDKTAYFTYKCLRALVGSLCSSKILTTTEGTGQIAMTLLLQHFGFCPYGGIKDDKGVSICAAEFIRGFCTSPVGALSNFGAIAKDIRKPYLFGDYDAKNHCFNIVVSEKEIIPKKVIRRTTVAGNLYNGFINPPSADEKMGAAREMFGQTPEEFTDDLNKIDKKRIEEKVDLDLDAFVDRIMNDQSLFEKYFPNGEFEDFKKCCLASKKFNDVLEDEDRFEQAQDESAKKGEDQESLTTSTKLLELVGASFVAPIAVAAIIGVCSMLRKWFREEKGDYTDVDDDLTCFIEESPPGNADYNQSKSINLSSKIPAKFVRRVKNNSAESKQIRFCEMVGQGVSCRVIPIKEDIFMTMAHGLRKLKEDTAVNLDVDGVSWPCTLKFDSIVDVNNRDLVFFRLENKSMPQFPNVSAMFFSRADMARLSSSTTGWWCHCDFGEGTVYSTLKFAPRINYLIDGFNSEFIDCCVYSAATRGGYCGTPLFVKGPNGHSLCCGFHVAGNSNKSMAPRAYAQLVTREDIHEALDAMVAETSDNNVEYEATVPYGEEVFVPTKGGFTPSVLQDLNKYEVDKAPAIVDPDDPRLEGADPLDTGFRLLRDWDDTVDVDEDVFENVVEDAKVYFSSKMDFHGIERELTLDEAVGGIPGEMTAMKVDSSLGFPLCLKHHHGKSDLIHLNPNEPPDIDPEFVDRVNGVNNLLEKGFERGTFRFLAFPKAELQRLQKIQEKNTRITYCGDSSLTAAARMHFGCLLIGFKNSAPATCANGLNQYSMDMESIYRYLYEVVDSDHEGVNFIAGDLKKMDQHYLKKFQLAAYDVLYECLPDRMKSDKKRLIWENFVKTQTESPVQYKRKMIFFKVAHFSGCVFTSIINNIVLQLYVRYLFALQNPCYTFDSCVRMVQQGDDHLIAVNRNMVPDFTQSYLTDAFKVLNQVYTDDTKSASPPPFRKFEDVTYLGAYPTQFSGQWCGKLRKSSIISACLWKRKDDDEIWRDTCHLMLEHASMWEKEFFVELKADINACLKFLGMKKLDVSYGVRLTVASRCGRFDVLKDIYVAESYTTFNTTGVVEQEYINLSIPREGGGIGGGDDDLSDGCDSFLYKDSFTWDKSQTVGADLYTVTKFPTDLIAKSNSDPQAVKFRSFRYYRSDFELRVQTNGNRTQQGAILLYSLFLVPENYRIGFADWMVMPHMVILPNNTEDLVYEIPYRSPYQFLLTNQHFASLHFGVLSQLNYTSGSAVTVNIYLRMKNYEFKVARPIADDMTAESDVAAENATMEGGVKAEDPSKIGTAAPAVKNEANPVKKFVQHRRVKKTTVNTARKSKNKSGSGSKGKKKNDKQYKFQRKRSDKKQVAVGKGGKGSKKGGRKFPSNNKKRGPLLDSERSKRAQQSWDNYFMRFGKPPVVKEGQLPYASKAGWAVLEVESGKIVAPPKNMCFSLLTDMVVGVLEEVLDDEMYEGIEVLSDVGTICSALGFFDDPVKYCLTTPMSQQASSMSNTSGGYYARTMQLHPVANYKPGRLVMDPAEMNLDYLFSREAIIGNTSWSISDAVNTSKFVIPLDSFLGVSVRNLGVPIFALNQFQFFHCTFNFRVYIFKTFFHTGRLRVVKAYGYDTVPDEARYTMDTEILNFDAETMYCDFSVPWVAMTDYLRVYDGPRQYSQTYANKRDFSLGTMRIEVANALCVANETVPIQVQCLLTVRLSDVRVAVPKVCPVVTAPFEGYTELPTFVAEDGLSGEEVEEIEAPDFEVDDLYPDQDNNHEAKPGFDESHSNLDIGAQFEFLPSNVLDISRRFVQIHDYRIYGSETYNTTPTTSPYAFVPPKGYWILEIPIRPILNPLTALYRGFSGSVTIRVYTGSSPCFAQYVPTYGGSSPLVFPPAYGDASVSNLGALTGYAAQGTTVHTLYTNQVRGGASNPPVEICIGTVNGNYFDLVCPFQQHTMFLTPETSPDFVIGVLTVGFKSNANDTTRIFQKVGDDGSFGIFTPPVKYVDGMNFDSAFPRGNRAGLNGYYL